MNEKSKFNLYEEDVSKTPSITNEIHGTVSQDARFVYLDVSKPLPEMIKSIRDELQNKPFGYELNLYILCGMNCHEDVKLLIGYLNSISEDYSIRYFIRGIVHASFVSFLFDENTFVEKSSMLLYKKERLHELMFNLMANPVIFRTFIQRFIDRYSEFTSDNFLDVTELETIGFKLNKF